MKKAVGVMFLLALLFGIIAKCTATQDPLNGSYLVTVINSQVSAPNITLLNITFHRRLTTQEHSNIQLFPPNDDLFLFQRTFEYFVIETAKALVPGETAFFISFGTEFLARVTISVLAAGDSCQYQAFGRCSQLCHNDASSKYGYTCSCIRHYSLQSDQMSCQANAPHPFILYTQDNEIKRYDTATRSNVLFYNLTNPQNSIDLFVYSYSNQILYYVDTNRELIGSTSLNNPLNENILISTNIGQITGFSYDWISNSLYYTDSQLGTINQYHINNNIITTVLTGLMQPKAITVLPDAPYRYMFWIESSSLIKRANMDGSNVITIATTVNPVAIAIDIVLLDIYWISHVDRITKSSLNGTVQEGIYNTESNHSVFTALSVFEDYIYITNNSNSVLRIDKFTGERITLFYTTSNINDVHVVHSLQQPRNLSDIDECLINNGGCGQGCVNTIGSYYCTCVDGYILQEDERTCHNTRECDITQLMCQQSCSNNTNGISTCTCNRGYALGSDGTSCHDINECVDDKLCAHGCHNTLGGYTCSCIDGLFLSDDLHSCIGCSVDNGGCSQLCVTSDNSFYCKCRSGFKLGSDGTSCFPELNPSLFLSITQTVSDNSVPVGSVYQTSTSGIVQSLTVPVSRPLHQTSIIYCMDISTLNRVLYYGEDSSIWMTSLDNDNRQLLLINNDSTVIIRGITYDWINNTLYWLQTNGDKGTILRASLNTNELTPEILYTNISSPGGIVINPLTNTLYWTEGGQIPRITKASSLHPFARTTLLSLPSSSQPTGIAIDYLRRKIIWGDKNRSVIEMSTLNGNDLTQLIHTPFSKRPFQLTINGDRIYWTTQGSSLFSSISLTNSQEDSILSLSILGLGNNPMIYGIATIDDNKRPGNAYHVCLLNSIECSHFCTINSTGYPVCTCPVGYVLLSDGKTCASSSLCTGPRQCQGSFVNISGVIPFFSKPENNGHPLNSLDQPIQWMNNIVSNCEVLSIEYKDLNCQVSTVIKSLLVMIGTQLYTFESDNIAWSLLNGRIVTVSLLYNSTATFCVNFEVSSTTRAVSCGHSNGGCSHFCTTSFSSLPICSCPHGLVLSQDGYTCIDPCSPNPCYNNGECQLSSTGQPYCNCTSTQYTGLYCTVPLSCTTGDTCATPSLSVHRYVGGDRLTPPLLSEGYCSSVNGYCVGVDECESCQCKPSLIYQYQSEKCVNINQECVYQFNGSSSLYVSSNKVLSSITHPYNTIINTNNGHLIDNNECTIDTIQIDTYTGWRDLPLNTLQLTTNSNIKISSDAVIQQLLGQLIRVVFSCTNSNHDGCLLFEIIGNSQASISLSQCITCNGNFEGYSSFSVPSFVRPSINNQLITSRQLQFNEQSINSCNVIESVIYSNDANSCSVSTSNNTLSISEGGNHIIAINIDAWNGISTGSVINATISCDNFTSFCVLFSLQESTGATGNNNDECSNSPCGNHGNCTSLGLSGYYCTCTTGYTGPNCNEVNYCLSHTCLNNGTCINGPNYGSCICPEGTVQPYCIGEQDRNTAGPCVLAPCNNGGTCIEEGQTYICQCVPGYTGLHCNTVDLCAVANSCPTNSTCISNGTDYSCLCNEYIEEGTDCVVSPCTPNPCMNDGICNISNSLTPVCTCVSGYYGNRCQNELGVNICTNETCKNDGTCYIDSVGNTNCNCSTGYTGERCEIEVNLCDPNPCQNEGICFNSQGTFHCDCSTGYTGERCENEVNFCDPNPCQNDGTCTNSQGTFRCNCSTGYTGERCENEVNFCDPSPCLNEGICFNSQGTFHCDCSTGYTGERCEIDINECTFDPCQNGGTCTNTVPGYTCGCTPGYIGLNCSQVCPINRYGQGCTEICQCGTNSAGCNNVDGTCICNEGYTGTTCNIPVCDQPCQNGGTCSAPFTCTCAETYRGRFCEERFCPVDFCNRQGTCQIDDLIDPDNPDIRCTCFNGYSGDNCEFQQNRFSGEQAGGLSVGLVIGLIIIAVLIIAAIFAVYKVYPYYRKRRAHRTAALWYLDTTLVRENPAVVESLLSKTPSLDTGIDGSTGLDNPMYGTTTGKQHISDDSISINSNSTEFQTSFSNYCENNQELFIPNTVIINPSVDTGERDSISPAPHSKGEESIAAVRVSMSHFGGRAKDNIYDSV